MPGEIGTCSKATDISLQRKAPAFSQLVVKSQPHQRIYPMFGLLYSQVQGAGELNLPLDEVPAGAKHSLDLLVQFACPHEGKCSLARIDVGRRCINGHSQSHVEGVNAKTPITFACSEIAHGAKLEILENVAGRNIDLNLASSNRRCAVHGRKDQVRRYDILPAVRTRTAAAWRLGKHRRDAEKKH